MAPGLASAALRLARGASDGVDSDGGRRPLEPVRLPWRPQGDVDLVGPGLDVLPDLVPRLLVAPGQRRGAEELGQAVELALEVLVPPGQSDVDGAADLVRVAPDLLAMAVQHLALPCEVLGRDEPHAP